MQKHPPCPNCQTEMKPRDDKYDCPKCKAWYYQVSFEKWKLAREKGEG